MSLKHALLASVFTLGLSTQGHAADATDAGAKALSDQLRAWLTGILTPKVPLPADMIAVAPAGSNYRIAIQSPADIVARTDEAGKPTNAWVTANVHPGDGPKWIVDSLVYPASLRLSPAGAAMLGGLMPPVEDGTHPGAPPKPLSLEWKIDSQSASGVFDPSLASDSFLDVKMGGIVYDARNLGNGGDSHTAVDKMDGHYVMHPTGSGGVDYRLEGNLTGYTVTMNDPNIGQVTFKSGHATVRMDTGAVMNNQIAELIRTAINVAFDAKAAEAKGGLSKEDQDKAGRAALRTMIGLLKGIMTGMKFDESVDAIDIKAAAGGATADRIGIAMGGEAPGDTLKAFLAMTVSGLKVVGVPPEMADFVPRKIVIHPVVSNIDVKALTQIANDAAADDADSDAAQAKLMALFTTGGVKIGFEHLDADMGYASMTGSGEATIVGPSAIQGTADIVVKGFDALMARASKMPDAAAAMGMLALAKGFGKTDGDRTVWHIAVSPDNKILVNGVDVTGGGAHH